MIITGFSFGRASGVSSISYRDRAKRAAVETENLSSWFSVACE